MAPAGRDGPTRPKPDWFCKICSTTTKLHRVRGVFNFCRNCNTNKGDAFSHNVPADAPSTSRVHPSRPGAQSAWNTSKQTMAAKIASKQLAETKEKLAAADKELAALKKSAAHKPPKPDDAVVIEVEPMDEDSDDKCGYDYDLESHRVLLDIAKKAGSQSDIAKYTDAIAVQSRAKLAAKPVGLQVRDAEKAITKLEKRVERLDGTTNEHKEAIAAAEAKLESHLAELTRVRGLLDDARLRKAQLHQKLSLVTPACGSPASQSGIGNSLDKLHELAAAEGAINAMEALPNGMGQILTTLLAAVGYQKDMAYQQQQQQQQLQPQQPQAAPATPTAAATAAVEPNSAADAAAAAAASASPSASASASASTSASASASASAAAADEIPYGPSVHKQPPPALHAPSPGPVAEAGCGTRSSLHHMFPDHCAESTGELSPSELALMEGLQERHQRSSRHAPY